MIELDEKSFDAEIAGNKQILVMFTAVWCAPCKMLYPVMEELSKTNVVRKVDVDSNTELCKKFSVRSVPTSILFLDGKEVKRFVGVAKKENILESLELHK